MHKKTGSKKSSQLGDQFTGTQRHRPIFGKTYLKIHISLGLPLKTQNVIDFGVSMGILRKSIFLDEFWKMLADVAGFEWIDLRAGMIFLIQVFLCIKIHVSCLRKKLFWGRRLHKQLFKTKFWFFVRYFSVGALPPTWSAWSIVFFSFLLFYSVCGNFWDLWKFVEILGWEVRGRGSGEIVGAAGALWKILAPVASGRGGSMF